MPRCRRNVCFLIALVQPQQTVIHENAGEPVAHSPVHQDRGYRGVHPAGETADHPALRPYGLPDASDLALDEVARRPVRRATTDFEEEVVEDLAPTRGMGHLGVELHAEEGALVVLERRDG